MTLMSEELVIRVQAVVMQYDETYDNPTWDACEGSGKSIVCLYKSLARILMNIFNIDNFLDNLSTMIWQTNLVYCWGSRIKIMLYYGSITTRYKYIPRLRRFTIRNMYVSEESKIKHLEYLVSNKKTCPKYQSILLWYQHWIIMNRLPLFINGRNYM